MNVRSLFSAALLLVSLPALAAAETITNFNGVLTSSSSIELGRPSRNGVVQTWTGAETYPGVLNPTLSYAYTTYTLSSSLFTGAPYVEISAFDTLNSGSDFLSAYANSYNVNARSTNWLGDEGQSGNYFGTDAITFDTILPVGSNLVLVLNDTSTLGLNDPINIEVDAYADTSYDDPVQVTPEPSTFVTLGTGLIWAADAARRRRRSHAV